jgi:hypothetical protein
MFITEFKNALNLNWTKEKSHRPIKGLA